MFTFWPKTNRDVGMLLKDMVIPPQVVDYFSHAFRHGDVNATHHERSLDLLCQSTPPWDARFGICGRKLSIRDGTKVKFDKNEYTTGAKDAGEFV
jgi:hypothetical protein